MGEIIRFKSRADFLSSRRIRLGASEMAGVCRASRYSTPLTTFNLKVHGIKTTAETIRLMAGNLMEPVITTLYEMKTGNRCQSFSMAMGGVECEHSTVIHDRLSYISASPDRIVVQDVSGRGRVNVQLKTAEPWTYGDWEESIPLYYYIQVQQEMECLPEDVEWTDLVTLFGYSELRIDRVKRNSEWFASLLDEGSYFWNNHILTRIAPDITAADCDREAAGYHMPNNKDTLILPPSFTNLELERASNAVTIKSLEDRNEVIKAQVKTEMMKAQKRYGVIPNTKGRYDWRTVNKSAQPAKPASVGHAFVAPRADAKVVNV